MIYIEKLELETGHKTAFHFAKLILNPQTLKCNKTNPWKKYLMFVMHGIYFKF